MSGIDDARLAAALRSTAVVYGKWNQTVTRKRPLHATPRQACSAPPALLAAPAKEDSAGRRAPVIRLVQSGSACSITRAAPQSLHRAERCPKEPSLSAEGL